ncbi:MAG: threonine ammonia-lyase [Bacteriovoracaceae bacterium]
MKLSDQFTRENVLKAKERIYEHISPSPCLHSAYLSSLLEADVYLKCENLQRTGSYKIRGAINCISQLTDKEREKGIIACSAGNHAQGVALASRMFGIKSTIVMPKNTPLSKVEGTRRYGAEIILYGNGFDEAFERMESEMKTTGAHLIHPFNDPDIICGQATVGLEILDQVPEVEMILTPIGGGGLASGVGLASHYFSKPKKSPQLIGIEAEMMPAMKESIFSKKLTSVPRKATIAEGIAVSNVGSNTFPIISNLYHHIDTVSEAQIARTMVKVLEKEKVLCEGAGAVGYAALSESVLKDFSLKGKKICVVLTGGNVDLNFLSKVVERGLGEDGRLANLQIIVPDVPGSMALVTKLVAQKEANILEIFHNRVFGEAGVGETTINLVLECKGREHLKELISSLKESFKVIQNDTV